MRSPSSEPDPGEPRDPPTDPGSAEDGSPPSESPDRAAEGEGSDAAGGPKSREEPSGGDDPGSPGPHEGLPGQQLERVIRRAVELQFEVGQGREDRLPDEEVVRIGREVGIDVQHVRRALAEYRMGTLAGHTTWEPDRLSPLLGPNVLRSGRSVPGRPAELQELLEEHFRNHESLRAVRRLPGTSLWEPAGGVLSAVQRSLNVHGWGYQLARARSVELLITEVGEERSLVTLAVDVRNVRAENAWGWVFLGFLAIFAPPILLGPFTELSRELLLAMGAGVGGGLAFMGTRRNVHRETGRIRQVMEGLLDRLEAGEPLQDETPSWRDRLLP